MTSQHSIWKATTYSFTNISYAVDTSKQFATLYKNIAYKFGIDFFDEALYTKAGYFDYWYFSPDGHKALAEAFAQYLFDKYAKNY